MAKKQTRRSVSIRGSTYELIRQHCEQNSVSMSEFVEDRISEFFGEAKPVQVAKAPEPEPKPESDSQLSADELQAAARYFTF